jgi:uncharacterized protein (DUF58 family)
MPPHGHETEAPRADLFDLPLPSRRHYELHPPGMLYLVITVFLAIGSINSQNNLLFLAFGLAIAGFLLSGLISGPPLMKIRARRHTPQPGAVGEHAEIRYTLENRSRWLGAMGLEVREITGDRRVSAALAGGSSGGVLNLRPGSTAPATVRITPRRRGIHRLGAFSVTTTFPFGLFRKTLVFEQPDAWTVMPRRVPLRNMPWQRSGRDGATLSATASRRGQSTEFYALRAYVPGDPTRQIAWRPSARLGELIVREQAASAPPKLWIRIDRPSPDTPDHLVERAAALVSALAQDATRAGFAIGLRGRGVGHMRPVIGPKQVRAIQTQMAALGPDAPDDDDDTDGNGMPPRALRVRVQYQRKGRGGTPGEFALSADDLREWFAGQTIPDEFEPAPSRSPLGRLAGSTGAAAQWKAFLGLGSGAPA